MLFLLKVLAAGCPCVSPPAVRTAGFWCWCSFPPFPLHLLLGNFPSRRVVSSPRLATWFHYLPTSGEVLGSLVRTVGCEPILLGFILWCTFSSSDGCTGSSLSGWCLRAFDESLTFCFVLFFSLSLFLLCFLNTSSVWFLSTFLVDHSVFWQQPMLQSPSSEGSWPRAGLQVLGSLSLEAAALPHASYASSSVQMGLQSSFPLGLAGAPQNGKTGEVSSVDI